MTVRKHELAVVVVVFAIAPTVAIAVASLVMVVSLHTNSNAIVTLQHGVVAISTRHAYICWYTYKYKHTNAWHCENTNWLWSLSCSR